MERYRQYLYYVCHTQPPEDKLIKLESTLQGWKDEHLGRMEMLFHYTSCEVCPPLPNFYHPSALLPSSVRPLLPDLLATIGR